MKLKITSFKQLRDGHLSFNLVFQPCDSCQMVVPAMRIMFGKIYPPACKRGGMFSPSVHFDANSAGAIYDELMALETPPNLMPHEEAVKPLLITQKVIDQYVTRVKDEEADNVIDEA